MGYTLEAMMAGCRGGGSHDVVAKVDSEGPFKQQTGHNHQERLTISNTLLSSYVHGLVNWVLLQESRIVWRGCSRSRTYYRFRSLKVVLFTHLKALLLPQRFVIFFEGIWQGFLGGLRGAKQGQKEVSLIGSMTSSEWPSTPDSDSVARNNNLLEEPVQGEVFCTQLQAGSRRKTNQGFVTAGVSGTSRPPSARRAAARASKSIRKLLGSSLPSGRGRKKQYTDAAGPSGGQNSPEITMAEVIGGGTNLNGPCEDETLHNPASNDQDRPCRFYTTSSHLAEQLSNSREELSVAKEIGLHPPPCTRSRSNAAEAFVNHHQLVAALLQTSGSFSAEAQGSGFVIAPDLRSVNVGQAAPSVLPPSRPPRTAGDPLAYLDGIFTSLGDCSNNGPLLNRYCLPEPNRSEEYARPNPQAYTPVGPNDTMSSPIGDALTGDDEVNRQADPPAVNPPVTITGEISISFRVRVQLNCMEWGGECLPVPCPHAVGVVVHIERDVHDVVKQYAVNFGDYFGVQIIEASDCEEVQPMEEAEALPPWVYRVPDDTPSQEGGNVQGRGWGRGRGRGGRGRSRGRSRESAGANITIDVAHTSDEQITQDHGAGNGFQNEEVMNRRGRGGRAGGRGRGRAAERIPTSILEPIHPNDLDDDSPWSGGSNGDEGSGSENGSYGTSESEQELDETLDDLAALGISAIGPMPEVEPFEHKYSERQWHCKSWKMKHRQDFVGPTPGPKNIPVDISRPCEFFELLWTDSVWSKMLVESNAYARWVDPKTGCQKGGLGGGRPITRTEHRRFIGICCVMGVKDQPEIRDYWKRKSSPLHCKQISFAMTRDRFEHILRCLHLTSNATYISDKKNPGFDPIGKTRWLLETLGENFRDHLNPGPYVCVDESMVAYNGRYCGFKQYMPAKPIKHGLKLWALCCSDTKYVLRLEVYVGASGEEAPELGEVSLGSGYGVVSRLTRGLDWQFYRVACDNYFTSPALFETLYNRGIYAIGTALGNRKGFPNSLRMGDKEVRGTLHIRMHRDQLMSAVYWSDCKGVLFLSTAVDPYEKNCTVTRHVSLGEECTLPCSPHQVAYSKNMRGVDVQDQLRGSYTVGIATKKWWHRLFFFGLDTSLTNSYLLYKHWCRLRNRPPMSHKDFQIDVACTLLDSEFEPLPPPPSRSHRRQPHLPVRALGRQKCVECLWRAEYICPRHNNVRLHPGVCWILYHNKH